MSTRKQLNNRRLKLYLEAEEKILQGQSYTISNRTLTRTNLKEVRMVIDDLLAQGAVLEGMAPEKNSRSKRIVFIS